MPVATEADVAQQSVRPDGEPGEEGGDPVLQRRPVAGQPVLAQHLVAQQAPQLLEWIDQLSWTT